VLQKKRSQLGRARSPGIPPPPFFSSYHFQQVTDQVLCVAAPYMDHNIPAPFWTRRQATNIIREKREKANGSGGRTTRRQMTIIQTCRRKK